ncbi:DNA translocase FtsK 4TM domain-containing protein [Candidatus Berkiella aquae]|nr:DNA translocase FtsK 4TM domain-containing protein [Candidatus Berkiella aquae]
MREGAFILLCSFGIYLLIALITYHDGDSAWSHSGMSNDIRNSAGKTGAWFSDVLFSLFGYMAYLFPAALGISGLFIYRDLPQKTESNPLIWSVRLLGLLVALAASCGLIALHISMLPSLPMSTGGLLGAAVKAVTVTYMNPVGSTVILLALLLSGVTLFTGMSWLLFLELIGHHTLVMLGKLTKYLPGIVKKGSEQMSQIKLPALPDFSAINLGGRSSKQSPADFEDVAFEPEESSMKSSSKDSLDSFIDEDDVFSEPLPSLRPKAKKQTQAAVPASAPLALKKPRVVVKPKAVVEEEEVLPSITARPKRRPKQDEEHALPDLSLLEMPEKSARQGFSSQQRQDLSRLVETRLMEFGVDAKVVGVLPGPVITRFELDLAAGIKVNKITGLAKDLARSLSVVSVRVVEVIPGKSVVGLEIPNPNRELVRLKEVLEDSCYQDAESPITLALGKDIAGRPVAVDLAKMPHLLVAGTTGSGKSVGVNAMLLSILYKASPEDVRLIMIDPKMLELAVYDNIPHLLTPVVTDMKDAANALRWCVAEMERRYQLMAAIGVRNLTGYNQKVVAAAKEGQPLLDPFWQPMPGDKPEPLEKLPYIVVVVDEFADMMMVVGKKVEELIARIAQKARAAGIHLILATQRPSVDVITGLIKANIPTRIAFQVSSRIDSRTIIDQSGAEQLLGHGDMLYLPPGVGIPHRIHGAFVSDDEVHKVTKELRKLGQPAYIESVIQSSPSSTTSASDGELDELYDQALAIVTESRKASISLVQRRLKIGYNRAARLIEQMESEGVVSSVLSNGTREVLAPAPIERG